MKNFFKFVASFFIVIFVIEVCLIKCSSAQLLRVTSDSNGAVYYLNTEKCDWMEDNYGNCVGLALVRCVEKMKSTYLELIVEFRRNANYSRKDAFADYCIKGIWSYDSKSGALLNSSTKLDFSFEPAIYGTIPDFILGALLDNCSK